MLIIVFMKLIYIIITLPIVEWPGSVLNSGMEGFIKAIIFFYFTITLVDTEKKLKIIVWLFMIMQIFRVMEPLYLNLTEGYWGSATFVSGTFEQRLSGSRSDVINPNELGYLAVVCVIFLYYMVISSSSFIFSLGKKLTAILFLQLFILSHIIWINRL